MKAWPGQMTRQPRDALARQVLATLSPGRLYTAEDISNRCKDAGIDMSPDALKSVIRFLHKRRKLVIEQEAQRTIPTIYRRAE